MNKYNLNKDEIYDWYINQNLTQDEICKKLNNIPKITLQRFLRKCGFKKQTKIDYKTLLPQIDSKLKLNITHKEIAKDLNLTIGQVREIIYKRINPNDNIKYSNKLLDDSWVNENNPIFWYIIGLISSDGHIDKNNCICIFQSNFEYLKNIQKNNKTPRKII